MAFQNLCIPEIWEFALIANLSVGIGSVGWTFATFADRVIDEARFAADALYSNSNRSIGWAWDAPVLLNLVDRTVWACLALFTDIVEEIRCIAANTVSIEILIVLFIRAFTGIGLEVEELSIGATIWCTLLKSLVVVLTMRTRSWWDNRGVFDWGYRIRACV